MASHETKYCPRCANTFECKVGNVLECQCNGITFTEAEKAFIGDAYNDCLCRNCLLALKREARDKPIKDKMNDILKGVK